MATSTLDERATGACESARNDWTCEMIIRLLAEERELHLSLAITIANNLEPADSANPADGDRLTEWRLATLLQERLGHTDIEDSVRYILSNQRGRAQRPEPGVDNSRGNGSHSRAPGALNLKGRRLDLCVDAMRESAALQAVVDGQIKAADDEDLTRRTRASLDRLFALRIALEEGLTDESTSDDDISAMLESLLQVDRRTVVSSW